MQEPHQEPLGVGTLLACARRAGHDASLYYFNEPEQAVRHAAGARPDVIAYSAMTGAHTLYMDLNRALKKQQNFLSVFGGPHPTYSPDMINDPDVDAVCRGEGESALTALLDRLENHEDYLDTPNFWFKKNGDVVKNDPAPLITDLDALPHADRDAFYQVESLRVSHLKSFMTGRGCPFNCTYCFNHQYNALYRGLGPIVRRRSVDSIIDEALEVKQRFPLGMLQFMDDIFILDAAWLEEFSEKFPARVGLPFFCNVRAELVTPEVVRDLVRAGCWSVCLGIETGDPDLRRRMLNRTQTDDQIREACRLLRANRIKIMTTNMLGIPGGDIESDWKTYRLNVDCGVDYPWVSLMYPYPGTRIHELTRQAGFDTPDPDQFTESYFNTLCWDAPHRTRAENLHRLLALASNFPRMEFLFRALVNTRFKPLRALFTLLFGFWKLYCYETRIFKRRDAVWLFSGDFLPRFMNNVALGFRMMFPRRNQFTRDYKLK